jgi:hypothetical protein
VQTLGASSIENGLIGGGERRRLEQMRHGLASYGVGRAPHTEEAFGRLVPGNHLLIRQRPAALKVGREQTFHRHSVKNGGTARPAAKVGEKAIAARGVLYRFHHAPAAGKTQAACRFRETPEAVEIFRQLATQCVAVTQVRTLFQKENPALRSCKRPTDRGTTRPRAHDDHVPGNAL